MIEFAQDGRDRPLGLYPCEVVLSSEMEKRLVRVFLVDDYPPFRQLIRAELQSQNSLELIGEAGDGLEAVQQAQELPPDLALLDIGLPRLNGIEAARKIRSQSPSSKILFMSENRSSDIAAAALGTGACGYVVKSDAATQLLPAVNAVLEGKRFIGSSLSLLRQQGHVMQFYKDHGDMLDDLGAC